MHACNQRRQIRFDICRSGLCYTCTTYDIARKTRLPVCRNRRLLRSPKRRCIYNYRLSTARTLGLHFACERYFSEIHPRVCIISDQYRARYRSWCYSLKQVIYASRKINRLLLQTSVKGKNGRSKKAHNITVSKYSII